MPQTNGYSGSPEKRKHDGFEWTELVFLILTFLAVSTYTVISGYQLRVSRDAEQRQMRAYVYTSPGTPTVTRGASASAKITIKMFGSTPAYNLHSFIEFNILPRGVKRSAMHGADGTWHNELKREILTPNDPEEIGVSSPGDYSLPATFYTGITKDGGIRVYIHGRTTYDDAFGCHRFVDYCYSIGGDSFSGQAAPDDCEDGEAVDPSDVCAR